MANPNKSTCELINIIPFYFSLIVCALGAWSSAVSAMLNSISNDYRTFALTDKFGVDVIAKEAEGLMWQYQFAGFANATAFIRRPQARIPTQVSN